MSYDLTFWRYRKKNRVSALRIYETLMDGSVVEGLDELPIQDIRENLLDLFSDWKLVDDMGR